jgi:hypothetical protein
MNNTTHISDEAVKQFVDKLINDPNININGFPDYIERKVYQNVVTVIMGIVDQVLSSTEIKILNHKIVFTVLPDEEDECDELD